MKKKNLNLEVEKKTNGIINSSHEKRELLDFFFFFF